MKYCIYIILLVFLTSSTAAQTKITDVEGGLSSVSYQFIKLKKGLVLYMDGLYKVTGEGLEAVLPRRFSPLNSSTYIVRKGVMYFATPAGKGDRKIWKYDGSKLTNIALAVVRQGSSIKAISVSDQWLSFVTTGPGGGKAIAVDMSVGYQNVVVEDLKYQDYTMAFVHSSDRYCYYMLSQLKYVNEELELDTTSFYNAALAGIHQRPFLEQGDSLYLINNRELYSLSHGQPRKVYEGGHFLLRTGKVEDMMYAYAGSDLLLFMHGQLKEFKVPMSARSNVFNQGTVAIAGNSYDEPWYRVVLDYETDRILNVEPLDVPERVSEVHKVGNTIYVSGVRQGVDSLYIRSYDLETGEFMKEESFGTTIDSFMDAAADHRFLDEKSGILYSVNFILYQDELGTFTRIEGLRGVLRANTGQDNGAVFFLAKDSTDEVQLYKLEGMDVEVSDEDKVDMIMYPNPTTDLIYIETGLMEDYTVEVYAASGQLVGHYGSDTALDVSDYPAGVYTVRVVGSDGTEFTKSFVKQ